MARWLFLLALAAASLGATNRSALLAWDHSPSPEVTAYRVHWGFAPRVYFTNWLVPYTNFAIAPRQSLKTNYYTVTACRLPLESDYSNEASWQRPIPKSNLVMKVTGQDLSWSPILETDPWRWWATAETTIVLTNPPATLYWRGVDLRLYYWRF